MKARERVIPAQKRTTVAEEIVSLTVEHSVGSVSLILGVRSGPGKFSDHRVVHLGPRGYELLIKSENPTWAPGKPSGEFRTEDIFAVMDLLGLS